MFHHARWAFGAWTVLWLTACGPKAAPGSLGEPCRVSGECTDGACLADLPGGYCSTPDCSACPSGSVCMPHGAVRACFKTCSSGDDCRDGYSCVSGACVGPCTHAEECGAGYNCTAETGRCVRKPQAGAACAQDADCGEGQRCLQPDGVCASACESSAECPAGQVCGLRPVLQYGSRVGVVALCSPPRNPGREVGETCEDAAACASGYCHLGRCTEPCVGSCEDPTLACVDSQEPLADDASAKIRVCLPARGTYVWDTLNWPDDYHNFVPVPGNAVAFEVMLEGSEDSVYPVTTNVESPGGTVLFDLYASDPMMQPVRFYMQNGVSMLMVPASNWRPLDRSGGYGYSPATYDPVMGDLTAEMPRARIFYKVAPGGTVSAGTLALNIFILPMSAHSCGALSAATAPQRLADSLAQVRKLYSKAGISLGAVNYFDLDRADLGTIDGDSEAELGRLFSQSAGHPDALNLFLVRSLQAGSVSGQGGMLLGVAGGIPGPPLSGTVHSGVVVSWAYSCLGGMRALGNVMSHEVGHYLGLFHNVEQQGGGTDDITDTDLSPDNLMYWNEEGGEQVTAGQGLVLRNNVMVE